jgi:hypothetical protein
MSEQTSLKDPQVGFVECAYAAMGTRKQREKQEDTLTEAGLTNSQTDRAEGCGLALTS